MATEYVNFQGKCKWAKLVVPNMFDKWSIDVWLDEAQVERFRSYKVKTYLKKDDDGYYVSFSRPIERMTRGKRLALKPPIVTGKDGAPINVSIGNGSDVTITCELYTYTPPNQMGGKSDKLHAIRLYAVRVDNLVQFEKDSLRPEDLAAVEQLEKTPPPPSW